MKQLIGYVEYYIFNKKNIRFIFKHEGSYIILGIHGKYYQRVKYLRDIHNVFVGNVRLKVIKF